MRDGSHLLVDLVRPDSPGGFPALMAASPYPRQLQDTGAPFGFVEAGASDFFVPRRYVHVLVNVRGTGGSDGTYGLFDAQERRDLYDVIEWVAAQPWCHGNVGMVGISAFAVAQFQAAVERPPHLRAVFPMAATLDLYEAFYHHGVFSERFATGLIGGIAVMASKTSRLFRNPVVDGIRRVLRTRGVHRRFQHFKGESAIAALAKVGARHIRAAPGDDSSWPSRSTTRPATSSGPSGTWRPGSPRSTFPATSGATGTTCPCTCRAPSPPGMGSPVECRSGWACWARAD